MSSPESSPDLSRKLRSLDLAVRALTILKESRTLDLQGFWQYDSKPLQRQGYSYDEVEQAFIDLANKGYTDKHGSYCYITDRGSTTSSADLIYQELKADFDEIKKKVKSYRFWTWATHVSIVISLVSILSLIPNLSSSSPFLGSLFALLFLTSIASGFFCNFKNDRARVPTELLSAVRFYDVYSVYRNVIRRTGAEASLASAERMVKHAGRAFKIRLIDQSGWATLSFEGKKISNIGEEITTRLIPAMREAGTSGGAERVGEVLANLTRYFIDPSSENMSKSLQLIQASRATQVPIPGHRDTLSAMLGNPIVTYAILAGLIIVGYVYLVRIMTWSIFGEFIALVGLLLGAMSAAIILAQRMKK
jgi:hypothetical protein